MDIQVGSKGLVKFGDNMDKAHGLPSLERDSVALVFTSPPYWNYMDYGEGGSGTEESYEHYQESLTRLWAECFDKVMPGGALVVNAANMKSRREESPDGSFIYPVVYDIVENAKKVGWRFFEEIIWVKFSHANSPGMGGKALFGSYPYPPTPKFMNNIYENLIMFKKPGKRSVDRRIKDRSKLTLELWREWTKGIWHIRPTPDKNHPATFPLELAERVVRLFSFVDDLVVDPFAGTGTAIAAASKWDRRGLGWELQDKFAPIIQSKWNEQQALFD